MSHLLSIINEPDADDCSKALLTAVHLGRETLSLAERIATSGSQDFTSAIRHMARAIAYLRAATELIPTTGTVLGGNAHRALVRATVASEAALGHARLAESYAMARLNDPFELQQVAHSRIIWKRAAEAARQESHRALAAVAALFPEACSVEQQEPER